jgi:hypothetical protein
LGCGFDAIIAAFGTRPAHQRRHVAKRNGAYNPFNADVAIDGTVIP